MTELSRRQLLAAGATAIAASALDADGKKPAARSSFRYCLNTSTIRLAEGHWGKHRPITDSIAIASKAGFAAIEPWIQELDEYTKSGGTLKDLKKRFADADLAVPDVIGFAEWLVNDDDRRRKGLEQAKRDMAKVQEIGGSRLAAPPVNVTAPIAATVAAERYKVLLELGQSMAVTPLVEVWGHGKCLNRLGETLNAAMECGTAGGAVLPDVYHLYKGGSEFQGLKLMNGAAIGIFHINDYPKIERGKIVDQDRVYPGDGIAPLKDILATLKAIGYSGDLSLELFNREYWKADPNEVAKTGLAKLKAIAE